MNLIVKNTVNTCVYGIIHVLTKYWCQLKKTQQNVPHYWYVAISFTSQSRLNDWIRTYKSYFTEEQMN